LSITTQAVTGTADEGIEAYNSGAGTSITINAQGAVQGGDIGIRAFNDGTGAVLITTRAVTGNTGDGIFAQNNNAASTSLTINAQGTVLGGDDGIYVRNYGTGAVTLTTQAVTGTADEGINVGNDGTSLTIDAQGAVQGGIIGIFADNDGTGFLSITTQAVTGNTENGIEAENSAAGTSITINAQGAVQGGEDGIRVRNEGTGAVSITTQAVIGDTDDGIDARNLNPASTSITINAQGAVQGADIGIRARNYGTGAVSITTQAVTGSANDGIYALNYNAASTSLTINAQGAVQGDRSGIYAVNNGTGVLSITANAAITGGTSIGSYGIRTETGAGGITAITLNAGAAVSSTIGRGIFNDAGNSTTIVNSGASIAGTISLGDGSDNLNFSGGDFSGVTLFDGGDDSGTADGFIDTLTFAGSSGAVNSALFANWENVVIGAGSTISFANNLLTVPMTTVTNGGVLDAGNAFTLNGNFLTSNGGIFDATGNGAGVFAINGNVANNGVFTMQDGAANDTITVTGNYSGTGELWVDVDFATDMSDVLAVGGNVTGGTTIVSVNDVSSGLASSNDVLVVDVTGTSAAGGFVLGNPIIGAFIYDLGQTGASWFLQQAGFNPATPTYEVYPQVLSSLNQLSSLRQRTSSRSTSGDNGMQMAQGYQSFAGYGSNTGDYSSQRSVFWGRLDGVRSSNRSSVSTTNNSFDTSSWMVQAGIDGQLSQTADSRWIFGLNGFIGGASADISSATGNGSISTDSIGLGLTATWYGDDGLYVDGQAQFSWFSSDLSDVTTGALVADNDGRGLAFSIEAGKTLDMRNGWAITPQAQLMLSSIDFDTFTGPNADTVTLNDGDSVLGRIGINFEQQQNRTGEDGLGGSSSFYALANLYWQFSGRSQVDVSGSNFVNLPDKLSGEIGLGGSFDLGGSHNGRKTTLFGEVTITTSLENFGDSNQYRGVAGVRINF